MTPDDQSRREPPPPRQGPAGEREDPLSLPSWWEKEGSRSILAPSSGEEAAAAVRETREAGRSLVVLGNGTKATQGYRPERVSTILRTTRLTKIRDYDRGNLTLTAETGATLASVQKMLAEDELFLPLDPPHLRATLGGLVAANSAGSLRARYGGVRDLLLGVEMALSNGELCRFGGKVVKNVAGYDLTRFSIGSLGTLGILTAVTLILYARPPVSRTLLGWFSHWRDALDASRAIRASPATPARASVYSPGVSHLLLGDELDVLGEKILIAVSLHGLASTVDRESREILHILERSGPARVLENDDAFWLANQQIPDRLHAKEGFLCCLRLSVPLGKLEKLLHMLSETHPAAEGRWEWSADVRSGIIRCCALTGGEPDAETSLSVAAAAISLAEESRRLGGSFVREAAGESLLEEVPPWGWMPPAFDLMRKIQSQFDPCGTLTPGRLFGSGDQPPSADAGETKDR